jgi:hypothetical protein
MDRETLFDLGLLQNFIGVRIIQIFAQYVLYYTCFYFESLWFFKYRSEIFSDCATIEWRYILHVYTQIRFNV